VTKAFSKSWSFREKALLELEQRVTGPRLLPPASIPDLVDPDPRAELRSTAFLLRRALQDQVLSIFRLATRFIKPTLVDFAERYGIPRVELHYALDKLVPVLFHRTGETSVRIREVAKAQIFAMAEWPQLRHSSTFWNEVVRPFSRVTLDRLALSRMELVTELYASRGVDIPGPDHGHLPASGFTLDAVATFTVKALNHRLNEVREAAENLMVALYRAENRAAIRNVMPPDDIEAQRHPLYRRLFGKFDRIDEKYAPVGVGDGGVVPDTVKKQKDLEALQAEVQQLRTIMSNDGPGRGSVAPRRILYVPAKDRSRVANRRPCLPKSTGKRNQKPVTSQQSKDESRTRTSKSRERFSPLPAQSAQLVGEAELLLSLDKTCIFCGEHNEAFTEEGLDLHYWKDCQMLHRCVNCKQVVEIAGMVDHLLTECEAVPPGHYVRCQRCFEAVPKADLSTHPCIPCVLGGRGLRCPLCHGDLPQSVSSSTLTPPSGPEDVWKAHLLGLDQNAIPICPDNPRRPIQTQQAVHLNPKGKHSPRMPTGARAQKQNGQMVSMLKPLSQPCKLPYELVRPGFKQDDLFPYIIQSSGIDCSSHILNISVEFFKTSSILDTSRCVFVTVLVRVTTLGQIR
ncbi:Centrosomal protein, partial [Paragonimus westermani]